MNLLARMPSNDEAMERPDQAQALLKHQGDVLDVSEMPSFGFGHRSLMWWGTQGLMLVEGTVFALCVAAYFYLASQAQRWPPTGPAPDWSWGTVHSVIALISLWPNHRAKAAAERLDLKRVQLWMVLLLTIEFSMLAVRLMEFRHLNVAWDDDAYGSVVWMLMGLHTLHLITDTFDSAVLAVLTFTHRMEGKRYVDVSENALYWYFVVWSWLPIYAVVYGAPRWL